MAKKTKKIEENSENMDLSISNEENNENATLTIPSEELMKDTKLWVAKEDVSQMTILDKPTLKSLSLFDLLNLEKAASIICKRYENSVKMYDGSIRQGGYEYECFTKYVDVHQKTLDEIERRLIEYK
jgi:hypothetical protein